MQTLRSIFVKGRGSELWDADGRRYLDFLCGIAVTSLGHAHPEVARAVSEQAQDTGSHFESLRDRSRRQVAATIDRLVGDGTRAGGQVFFCNSGLGGERVRHQARTQMGRERSPRDRERTRIVPRAHLRIAERHRAAGQAQRFRAARSGIRARCVRRPRRTRRGVRPRSASRP